jgi:hypothetical protein
VTEARAVEETIVEQLRRHWEEGWNAGDVDVIMAPFAEDVVFASPFVARLAGDPSATIAGRAALRDYVAGALARTPGIRYTLDAVYVGVDAVVLVYTCHLPDGTDRRGADSMRVGVDGAVVDWRCHYEFDFIRS